MEVTARAGRERPPTGVLTAMLIAAVAAGAVLLTMALGAPGSGSRFSVGNAVGTACPPGEGIPVCFSVTVTNTGHEPAAVRCDVRAARGNTASFLGGGPAFASDGPLQPGQPLRLTVAVTTQTDVVLTPSVACASG